LSVIRHNYFDSLIKLFPDLYLVKFLNTSAKLFFPYIIIELRDNDVLLTKENVEILYYHRTDRKD